MSKSKTVLEMAVAGIDGRTEMSWEVDEEVNQDKNGEVLTCALLKGVISNEPSNGSELFNDTKHRAALRQLNFFRGPTGTRNSRLIFFWGGVMWNMWNSLGVNSMTTFWYFQYIINVVPASVKSRFVALLLPAGVRVRSQRRYNYTTVSRYKWIVESCVTENSISTTYSETSRSAV